MKIKSLLPIICFLAAGVYAGSIILNTTQKSAQISKQKSSSSEEDQEIQDGAGHNYADSIPKGPNGGCLLKKNTS
jgi:hypothetical protein